jgi:hypothetical protein
MITLKAPTGSLIINPEKAEALELKLNLSEHRRQWLILGDVLYNAHAKHVTGFYTISDEQFFWILKYI